LKIGNFPSGHFVLFKKEQSFSINFLFHLQMFACPYKNILFSETVNKFARILSMRINLDFKQKLFFLDRNCVGPGGFVYEGVKG
jgi:hypothetical protein